ncbi:MAG TPA: hypothetical protein VNF47_23055, partial [Streptosporangiaceae bacterium]|nr:hypothetical protein [Streptosporangiaceae bacterium]
MAASTSTTAAGTEPDAGTDPVVHILWMNGGLGCDGDSVALTAATQPSIEEIVLGALPGLPRVNTRDFRCLWRSELLPLSCSVSVFESCCVVPPRECGHGFSPRVAAGT